MPKFLVDFELTGHIEVEAKTYDEAIKIVESINPEKLLENIQHFNVGKHYVERISM